MFSSLIKCLNLINCTKLHVETVNKGSNPQTDLDIYIEWNATYGNKNVGAEDYDNLSDESEDENNNQ